MNSLFLLSACVATASACYAGYQPGLYPWAGRGAGYYCDTPYAYARHGYDHGGYNGPMEYRGGYNGPMEYRGGYNGPQASPVVLPTGFLADTNAVSAAKSAHLTAYANTPTAEVLSSGYLADTPAVAAVKDAHLRAVANHGGAAYTGYARGYEHGNPNEYNRQFNQLQISKLTPGYNNY